MTSLNLLSITHLTFHASGTAANTASLSKSSPPVTETNGLCDNMASESTVRPRKATHSPKKARNMNRDSHSSRISEEEQHPLIATKGKYITLSWNQIAPWQQDNEYILSGYRPASASFKKSLKSILRVHNETINIYSHLIGSILFFTLPIWTFTQITPRYGNAQVGDIVVFSTFFFGVAICFFLSASFHVVANHSQEVHRIGNQLDYLGIVILMYGATIPSIYYGFYCDSYLQKVYWSLSTILGAACVYATLHPRFRHPTLRPYRSAMYTGFGLSALVFIAHGLIKYGWEVQKHRMALPWMAVMATFNLTGAATYAARIPERWFPRKYDIVGSSHQILHFMVIFAGLAHMVGLIEAFDYLHSQDAPCG